MKKTYTRKQITEALAYWKNQLDKSDSLNRLRYAVSYDSSENNLEDFNVIAVFLNKEDAELFVKADIRKLRAKYPEISEKDYRIEKI